MSDTILSPSERTCCYLLSDLFLDTELQDFSMEYIVRELHQLPLSLQHIENLFWHDVYPVLIYNLASVAGEWMYFEEDEVCQAIELRRANKLSMTMKWLWVPVTWVLWSGKVEPDWAEIKKKLVALDRSIPLPSPPDPS
jgi:hypothetical protein